MVVWGEKSAGIEESVKKTGGSGSGEAAEGLVQLGKNVDEPVSSEQETLINLLKRVTESYNPKKKVSSKAKTPGTARAKKKGRTTRSQLKQNEAELEKALEESRTKVVAKGKKKMGEHVEAVDINEMDLVLRDEDETKEAEVVTPKAKKAKTSTKKSVSESKPTKPSTLEKRTRSAVKSRKVKIAEEEEWSGEEEDDSNTEKDKMAKFGKRTILKGRLLRDLEEQGMVLLLEKLQLQGWRDMVLQLDGRLARNEIVEFMENDEVKDGRVTSMVKGVNVTCDVKDLGEILGVPAEGYNDYKKLKWPRLENLPTALPITRKFSDNEEEIDPKAVYKSEMKPPHKVLFEFVNKCVLPRQERKHIATFLDLVLIECLDSGSCACTFQDTYEEVRVHTTPIEPGSSKKVPVNSKVQTLVQESGAKDAEIDRLKKRLAEVETEIDALRTELAKEKEKNDGILQDMLKLPQAKNQASGPSQP
ncbi:intracellular protein transport protein USO1-like [Nicotiana tomentosiformis]|uniref:intracellular protein transport protein USO1-like n=1 Tax=Nicotiana tomentosiformis TaxID=4098 RepID=UPI00388C3E24